MDNIELICGDGYDMLRTAICIQAMDDYKRAYRAFLRGKTVIKVKKEGGAVFGVSDLEKFFQSGWFYSLSGDCIDGNELMNILRKQVKVKEKYKEDHIGR